MKQTVELLKVHPSISYWTIFNEGWGQFESDNAYDILKSLDNTRFIDTTSGWFFNSKSDVVSKHIYFKKVKIKKENRPVVVSEFGGFAYKVDKHTFQPKKIHGYGKAKTRLQLVKKLRELYQEQIIPQIEKGLCGAIYTQLSDVEDEINGILTFDRAECKINAEEFIDINTLIYEKINQ